MKWRRTHWPPYVADLLRREPGLCVRLIGWREAEHGADVITIDRRGRFWLWASVMSQWVNADGEQKTHVDSKFAVRHRALVPVFGPITPTARRDREFDLRAAIDALED